MSNTELTVVAAVSRPERAASVVAGFERQTHPAQLLLVLNGAAEESVAPVGDLDLIRCKGGNPARARNAGLQWVQQHRGGIVAFWDDDDHYGPGYLAEVARALDGHPRRVVGKIIRTVEFDDGRWLFLRKQGHAFLGGTIAGWARELPPIPDLPCHEDHEWCRLLEQRGFELKTLSGAHYVYNRRKGEHAWRSTRTQMLHCYGPAFSLTTGEFLPRATLDDIEAELLQNLLARSKTRPVEETITI